MERVLGIGGVFVRARDPGALAEWYRTRLGVEAPPESYGALCWRQAGGSTVFAPFKAETTYFPAHQQVMLNFRVRDLAVMLAQLRRLGEEVAEDPETCPNGRFARVHDPEGNAVELWEPQGSDREAEEA